MEKIRLGYDNLEGPKIVLFLAADQGLYRKHDLELSFERVSPVKLGTPKLLSGALDVLVGNSGPVVEAIIREQTPLAVIGSLGPAKFAIFTSANVKKAQDLRGKRFGVSTPGASQDRIARRALKRLGLEPEKDLEIVYTGFNDSSHRLKALARGAVDAVIGGMEHHPNFPDLQAAEKSRVRTLIELTELGIYISGSDIAASRACIESRRETVKRLLRALEESLTLAKSRADLVEEAFAKHLNLHLETAKSKAEEFQRLPPPQKPSVDRRAVQSNIDELQEQYPDLKSVDITACIEETLV
ncbi:MAG TPA: ABC transporter substrate-binding protein [Candidatus Binatia bacterium]|jgi:ABC-type nitrate/sulfonate/bicarbonate transport system substrate-binding protein